MAGLGKKTFAAGEVLRAADVNGYLMDQAVQVYAGTAARGSAIGTASEGMVSYLNDINAIEFYDGSAWKNAGSDAKGLVAFSETLSNTTFLANTNTKIIEVTFTVIAGRRYLINGKIAVQPSATTAPNGLYVTETTMGIKLLAYRTTAIGANLNESFTGFHSTTAAAMGVTSGTASKTIGLYWRCGSAGAVATNPDNVFGTNSFVPQLVIADIGAA